MGKLLGVRDLTVRFGERSELEKLSFEPGAGDVLAVVGSVGGSRGAKFALENLLGANREKR